MTKEISEWLAKLRQLMGLGSAKIKESLRAELQQELETLDNELIESLLASQANMLRNRTVENAEKNARSECGKQAALAVCKKLESMSGASQIVMSGGLVWPSNPTEQEHCAAQHADKIWEGLQRLAETDSENAEMLQKLWLSKESEVLQSLRQNAEPRKSEIAKSVKRIKFLGESAKAGQFKLNIQQGSFCMPGSDTPLMSETDQGGVCMAMTLDFIAAGGDMSSEEDVAQGSILNRHLVAQSAGRLMRKLRFAPVGRTIESLMPELEKLKEDGVKKLRESLEEQEDKAQQCKETAITALDEALQLVGSLSPYPTPPDEEEFTEKKEYEEAVLLYNQAKEESESYVKAVKSAVKSAKTAFKQETNVAQALDDVGDLSFSGDESWQPHLEDLYKVEDNIIEARDAATEFDEAMERKVKSKSIVEDFLLEVDNAIELLQKSKEQEVSKQAEAVEKAYKIAEKLGGESGLVRELSQVATKTDPGEIPQPMLRALGITKANRPTSDPVECEKDTFLSVLHDELVSAIPDLEASEPDSTEEVSVHLSLKLGGEGHALAFIRQSDRKIRFFDANAGGFAFDNYAAFKKWAKDWWDTFGFQYISGLNVLKVTPKASRKVEHADWQQELNDWHNDQLKVAWFIDELETGGLAAENLKTVIDQTTKAETAMSEARHARDIEKLKEANRLLQIALSNAKEQHQSLGTLFGDEAAEYFKCSHLKSKSEQRNFLEQKAKGLSVVDSELSKWSLKPGERSLVYRDKLLKANVPEQLSNIYSLASDLDPILNMSTLLKAAEVLQRLDNAVKSLRETGQSIDHSQFASDFKVIERRWKEFDTKFGKLSVQFANENQATMKD